MIFYITRNKIDIKKYDECIKKSYNSRIYAFSWYLDCVTETWDALILDDYKAVMPLPKRKKYGITYVYQPSFTQQLGFFSVDKISDNLIKLFIKAIPKKIKFIEYNFNSENKIIHKKIKYKNNYLLPLEKPYKNLYKEYNNNRKRALKKAYNTKFSINKNGDLQELISIKQYNNSNNKPDVLKKLKCLIKEAVKLNYGEIWTVTNKDKQCIAGICWIKSSDRITYLYPVASKQAKHFGIPTMLIDEMIKTYANTNNHIDFEGSMINGVAKFYKSFNTISEEYFNLKKWLIL